MATPKIKDYFKPTPKRLRILGDTLLAVSTMVTASAIAGNSKWLAVSSLIVGVLGKFMTNFFKDESSNSNTDS